MFLSLSFRTYAIWLVSGSLLFWVGGWVALLLCHDVDKLPGEFWS